MKIKYKNNTDLSLLPEIFTEFPGILAVYLFGSAAEDKMHYESDLDLAIVPVDETVHHHRLDILTSLSENGFCNVDIVYLDTDDIVLKYEAVHKNQLIYQSKKFNHGNFYSKIIRQYLDFLPYLDIQRAAYKRRLIGGQA